MSDELIKLLVLAVPMLLVVGGAYYLLARYDADGDKCEHGKAVGECGHCNAEAAVKAGDEVAP